MKSPALLIDHQVRPGHCSGAAERPDRHVLVKALGGRIWALPRAGDGAEFGFSLPVLVDDDM